MKNIILVICLILSVEWVGAQRCNHRHYHNRSLYNYGYQNGWGYGYGGYNNGLALNISLPPPAQVAYQIATQVVQWHYHNVPLYQYQNVWNGYSWVSQQVCIGWQQQACSQSGCRF